MADVMRYMKVRYDNTVNAYNCTVNSVAIGADLWNQQFYVEAEPGFVISGTIKDIIQTEHPLKLVSQQPLENGHVLYAFEAEDLRSFMSPRGFFIMEEMGSFNGVGGAYEYIMNLNILVSSDVKVGTYDKIIYAAGTTYDSYVEKYWENASWGNQEKFYFQAQRDFPEHWNVQRDVTYRLGEFPIEEVVVGERYEGEVSLVAGITAEQMGTETVPVNNFQQELYLTGIVGNTGTADLNNYTVDFYFPAQEGDKIPGMDKNGTRDFAGQFGLHLKEAPTISKTSGTITGYTIKYYVGDTEYQAFSADIANLITRVSVIFDKVSVGEDYHVNFVTTAGQTGTAGQARYTYAGISGKADGWDLTYGTPASFTYFHAGDIYLEAGAVPEELRTEPVMVHSKGQPLYLSGVVKNTGTADLSNYTAEFYLPANKGAIIPAGGTKADHDELESQFALHLQEVPVIQYNGNTVPENLYKIRYFVDEEEYEQFPEERFEEVTRILVTWDTIPFGGEYRVNFKMAADKYDIGDAGSVSYVGVSGQSDELDFLYGSPAYFENGFVHNVSYIILSEGITVHDAKSPDLLPAPSIVGHKKTLNFLTRMNGMIPENAGVKLQVSAMVGGALKNVRTNYRTGRMTLAKIDADAVITLRNSADNRLPYIVEHYKQQLDGSYLLDATESPLYGESGTIVSAVPKEYEHYRLNEAAPNSLLSGTVTEPVQENGEIKFLTLKAYYDLDTHTVTYNLNEGTAGGTDYSDQTVKYGENVTVKAAPSRSGYRFDGWRIGTTGYQPGEVISVQSNITLVAQWIKEGTPESSEKVTITYQWVSTDNPNDVNVPGEDTIKKGTAYTAKNQSSTAQKHRFSGWYTDEACTTKYVNGTVLDIDTILYGKWAKEQESNNGGSGGESNGSSGGGGETSGGRSNVVIVETDTPKSVIYDSRPMENTAAIPEVDVPMTLGLPKTGDLSNGFNSTIGYTATLVDGTKLLSQEEPLVGHQNINLMNAVTGEADWKKCILHIILLIITVLEGIFFLFKHKRDNRLLEKLRKESEEGE